MSEQIDMCTQTTIAQIGCRCRVTRVTECAAFRYVEAHAAKLSHYELAPESRDCANYTTKKEVKAGWCEMAPGGKCPYVSWKDLPVKVVNYLI